MLEGPATAGGVVLLDERWRRRPVGLLAGDATTAGTPLTGQLYYLRRALEPTTELREGDLTALLSRELSVLVLADRIIPEGPERTAIADWVSKGGLLVRFAGSQTAEHPDTLLPVKLLEGDRQLGGAMSWSQPAGLAEFPAASPFAGLPVPAEVRITRQVLAAPGIHLGDATWARLADGTPLVTQAARGAGRVVLFHITANADWSDLPLSGLFVDMLRRLVAVANGITGGDEGRPDKLAPYETLDGFGQPGPPPPVAAALTAAEIAAATVSPPARRAYGPENWAAGANLGARMAARPRRHPPAPPGINSAASRPGRRGALKTGARADAAGGRPRRPRGLPAAPGGGGRAAAARRPASAGAGAAAFHRPEPGARTRLATWPPATGRSSPGPG